LDKNKILPVDSKFSLENYNRLVECDNKNEREKLEAAVRTDLKARIDETSKYIKPEQNTMDFALMFIPSEALYYDLLVNQVGAGVGARDLLEYALRDKKVIIVSPVSFMAYLQTVLQGLKSLQIEKEAQIIQKRVAELGLHLAHFDNYMLKLGRSLGVSVNHFNSAHKELAKIDRDVVKVAGTKTAVEPLYVQSTAEV
jgi:DNA recombination protein RmuC